MTDLATLSDAELSRAADWHHAKGLRASDMKPLDMRGSPEDAKREWRERDRYEDELICRRAS